MKYDVFILTRVSNTNTVMNSWEFIDKWPRSKEIVGQVNLMVSLNSKTWKLYMSHC